ncbi:hypothetical protein [Kitasatospora sp. NPDC088351]|uniref:hypothetical protein n=1 Tax=unclassified Kitasatospora TaxID=2633591 RepID=UPI003444985B
MGSALTAGCALTALTAGPAWAGLQWPATAAPSTAPSAGPGATAATASDSDLEVIGLDPDPAAPGGTTTVHAVVGNRGPDRTASPFTVVVTLPAGVTPEGPYFPENCAPFQDGHRVHCTFPAGLPALRSATALIPVRLARTVPAPGTLLGGWVSVRGDDDRNTSNDKQPFAIPVVETEIR